MLGAVTSRISWGVVLGLFALSIATCALVALFVKPRDMALARTGDDIYYRSMSFNLFAVTRPDLNTVEGGLHYANDSDTYYFDERNNLNHQPPFVWRVATPLIARALAVPLGSIDSAYYALTFLSLSGAAFILAMTLYRGLGTPIPSLVAVGVFPACYWLSGLYLYHFMYVDPLSIFLSCLAMYGLVRRNAHLFFATCAAGVLNKEAALPLLLVYPLSEWLLERKVRPSILAAAALVGACWLALKIGLGSLATVNTYSAFTLLRVNFGVFKWATFAFLLTVGVFVVPAWRGLTSPLTLSVIPLLVFPVLGSIQGANDATRYLAQLLPVFVVFAFAFWPRQRSEQLFSLMPAVIYAFMPVIVTHDQRMNRHAMLLAFLVAGAAELVFARRLFPRVRWGWRRPVTA